MPKSIALIIGCLLLLVSPGWAQDEFPDPLGYVSDFAGVISGQDETRMTAIISELEEKTTAQMAVVTMPDIGGQSEEIYANKLFAAWGIGVKGKDNGILLLVAIKERRFRIETGYGLEGILPDGLLGQVADEQIIPHLRQDQYGPGLLAGTLAIAQIIAQDAGVQLNSAEGELPTPPVTRPRSSQGFNRTLMLFLFFFIFASISPLILLIALARRHGGLRGSSSFGAGFGSFGGGGGGGSFGGFGGGFSGGGGVSRGF